jgi:hypothetical protein
MAESWHHHKSSTDLLEVGAWEADYPSDNGSEDDGGWDDAGQM